MSDRQLLRRFRTAVGYGPKTLHRVLRFQRFLARAGDVAAGDESLARVAAELGYADQAHLTRGRPAVGRYAARARATWVGAEVRAT